MQKGKIDHFQLRSEINREWIENPFVEDMRTTHKNDMKIVQKTNAKQSIRWRIWWCGGWKYRRYFGHAADLKKRRFGKAAVLEIGGFSQIRWRKIRRFFEQKKTNAPLVCSWDCTRPWTCIPHSGGERDAAVTQRNWMAGERSVGLSLLFYCVVYCFVVLFSRFFSPLPALRHWLV